MLCYVDVTHASERTHLFHVCFTSVPISVQSLKSHRHRSVPHRGFLSSRAARGAGGGRCRTAPRSTRRRFTRPQLLQAQGSPSESDTPGWLCAEACCSSGHAASSPEAAPGNSLALPAASWISTNALLSTEGDCTEAAMLLKCLQPQAGKELKILSTVLLKLNLGKGNLVAIVTSYLHENIRNLRK